MCPDNGTVGLRRVRFGGRMNMLHCPAQAPIESEDDNANDVTRSFHPQSLYTLPRRRRAPPALVRIGAWKRVALTSILMRKQNNQRGESSILRPSDMRDREANVGAAHNRTHCGLAPLHQ
ncbi:hypothetical protein EXIGLDRAFT_429752 [Exidia glandulosa HHB12029]|uniref:Uncharacterized protein n=1 Tax=Exidia glandulosa HHB12029 TaxID=1314781 RepID=A0A165BB93_EXIGL|nr:hypothetical protein EXIGLDRAFT_429752 [Exidia glandulosa HHB12029]